MTGYQKSIAYLDYLENGMKTGNAGFVKVEESSGQMRLEMRVKNIPENFSGQYELKADTGETIGRIELNRGTGSCCIVWKTGSGGREGKKAVQTNGVYIRLPGKHLLQAVWPSLMEFLVEDTAEDRVQSDDISKEERETKSGEVVWETTLPETVSETPVSETDPAAENFDDVELKTDGPEEENERPAEAEEKRLKKEPEKENEKEPICYGDKWEQLTHMYAQIHPFGDEREYLSIAPKDFVVLRQEYQKMVHNSFLLHGYYNYKHLILGKIEEKGGWSYYLGVPGNFYNREKMVAEMFGFEAFEGERNPAKAGDFGYYMKKVEI